jgi:hypothetical protein
MVRSSVMSAVLLVLAVPLVAAQPGRGPGGPGGFGFGGMGGMMGSGLSLLRMEEVQKELGISDAQKKDVEELQAAQREQMRSAGGGFNREEWQKLSQEEREKRMAEMGKKFEENAKQTQEKLDKILDKKQAERLAQLRLQREGLMALSREDIQKKLGLTEDQIAKMRKIQEDARPGRGAFGGPDQSAEERRAAFQKMQEQREKMQKDILAVLTEKQKDQWTEMKGKEFKFPQMGFGPGGGRPGAGPGAGGGERKRPASKSPGQ